MRSGGNAGHSSHAAYSHHVVMCLTAGAATYVPAKGAFRIAFSYAK